MFFDSISGAVVIINIFIQGTLIVIVKKIISIAAAFHDLKVRLQIGFINPLTIFVLIQTACRNHYISGNAELTVKTSVTIGYGIIKSVAFCRLPCFFIAAVSRSTDHKSGRCAIAAAYFCSVRESGIPIFIIVLIDRAIIQADLTYFKFSPAILVRDYKIAIKTFIQYTGIHIVFTGRVQQSTTAAVCLYLTDIFVGSQIQFNIT